MSYRVKLVIAIGLGLGLYSAPPVFAQAKKAFPVKRLSKGEVKGLKQNLLMVSEGLEAYYVQILPNATVNVTGKGDLSLLQAGMYVRLKKVKMDKKGIVTEEIKELELYTYHPQNAPTGVAKEGDGEFFVAGRIDSFSKGQISVVVGKSTVKGTVAKDAELNILVSGVTWVRLAKAGDTVKIVGQVQKPPLPNSPGLLVANEVDLEVSKPVAMENEKAEKTRKKKPDKEKPAKEKE